MKKSRYRLISQIAFFSLFLYLLNRTEYTNTQELRYPVKLFLDFDPLIAITTFLTTYTIPLLLWLSAITLALTFMFGRFFCGWVCPFGSINHFVSYLFNRFKPNPKRGSHAKYQNVKYIVLFVFLGGSITGVHWAGWLDPISLTIRSFTVGILPVTNYILRSALYPILGSDSAITERFLLPAYPFIKKSLLSYDQTFYWQGFFVFSVFIGILLLNLIKNRFYCRVICPLGALLGACSKYSIFELDQSEQCNECARCVTTSQGGASPEEKGKWKKSECILCLNCVSECGKSSLKFRSNFSKDRKTGNIDLRRRSIITSFASGLLLSPFLKLSPRQKTFNPTLIRPPGSLLESEFLKRCIKCEECMKVCLTNVLQPTLNQAGLEGIWSPYLDMKVGYCEYNCNLCGQVCPTGAIKRLPVEVKKTTKIGLAFVDKNRCLPYSFDTPCIVCEEHCPTPKKAIWLEDVIVKNHKGETVKLKRPHVIEDICIGCGICEFKCPGIDKAAIRVTSIGEDRNPKNKMSLQKG